MNVTIETCRCGRKTFQSADGSTRCTGSHLHPDQCHNALARHLYSRWKEAYDGPESATIEELATIELCHVTDDEFEEAVEEAERIKAIESYVSAFGKRPRLTASGWPRR